MSTYRKPSRKTCLYDFQVKGDRFHGSTGASSKRAADEFERRLRNRIAAEGAAAVLATQGMPAPELTLDVAIGRWWEDKGERLDSAKDRERDLKLWIELLGRHKVMRTVRENDVAQAINRRRSMRYRGKGKLPSDATIDRFIAALRAVWRHLDSDEYPLPRIKWGKWTSEESIEHPPEISDAQISKLHDAARARASGQRTKRRVKHTADWVDLMVTCYATYGLRAGELYFPPGSLDVDEAKIFIPKKRRKKAVTLVIPLSKKHCRLLAARKSRAVAAGLPHLWFDERDGKLTPIKRSRGDYQLRQSLCAAGLGTSIHRLRHHVGTRLLRNTNGNLKLVKEALGHASIQSTQRYARVSEDDLRAAFSRHSPDAEDALDEKAEEN